MTQRQIEKLRQSNNLKKLPKDLNKYWYDVGEFYHKKYGRIISNMDLITTKYGSLKGWKYRFFLF